MQLADGVTDYIKTASMGHSATSWVPRRWSTLLHDARPAWRRRMRTRPRAAITVVVTLLSLMTLAGSSAAENPFADVTGFTTRNVKVVSQGCKDVPVTMAVTEDPSVWYTDVTTHIYRGTTEVDYDWFEANKPDTWLWCHFMGGFGRFRLGPSDVTADTDDGTYTGEDLTYGYVKVKAGSRAGITRAVRSGRRVTLTARATAYVYSRAAFRPWRNARVVFQHRLPTATAWTSTAAVTTTTDGTTTATFRRSKRYWRAVVLEGPRTFGSTSGSVLR